MDFGSLLLQAQKNENKQTPNRFYQTKFSAPKKETKQTKELSDNIKKFLARKEQEEKQKALEEKKKKDHLLSLRDEKAKNKINKHLKITKSANKSVLEDAIDHENTAVTLAGPAQCDEDDYGYVSQEASAFYDKLMNKYSSLPPEKSIFSSEGKKTTKDIASTKDRVKQALKQQQLEESLPHKRKRKHKESDTSDVKQEDSYKKHDRENEKEREEEVQKVEKQPPKKKKLPMPPPFDYTSLLNLAEKKQFEPVPIVPKVKEEPERLLTKKQMKEYAVHKEWKERKEQQNRQPVKQSETVNGIPNKSSLSKDSKVNPKPTSDIKHEKTVSKTLPTITKKSLDNPRERSNNLNKPIDNKNSVHKPVTDRNTIVNKSLTSTSSNSSTVRDKGTNSNKPPNAGSSLNKSESKNSKLSGKELIAEQLKKVERERKRLEELQRSMEEEERKKNVLKNKKIEESKSSSQKLSTSKTKDSVKVNSSSSKSVNSKESVNSVKSRQLPPADVKPRQFPPADVRPRQFPPADCKPRQFPPPDVRPSRPKPTSSKLKINKRRIYDEDDDEYDPDLDDFIDDGPEDDDSQNYSKYISEIFGYDKSKYRDAEDDDDMAMESNFAQQLKEEFRSTKLGIMEDLVDIENERREKQRKKMMMKKRR